jgi:Bacterial trigger factor protein (TF)/FKBP-type peptidyl-prolyl cis-trans isomerase
MSFRLALFLWSTTSPFVCYGASFVHHHSKNAAVKACTQSRPFVPSVCHLAAAAAAADDDSSPITATTSSSAVVVTRLADSSVEIEIPVPGSATKAAYDKVCNELSKNIQIPGFRKGSRIPPQVLEQTMAAKGGRNALKVRAINELLLQLVEPTMKEQSLQPIGQATLKIPAEELADSYKPGQELRLPVKCDVWPEIEWKGGNLEETAAYVGLEATYKRKPFNQAKMDLALRDLKERYATLEPIEDADYALQMGDACTVNMDGYMAKASADGTLTKGEPLPNAASGDRVEVVLGKGRYMEGLVEGLVGAKVGETRTVNVNFPEVRICKYDESCDAFKMFVCLFGLFVADCHFSRLNSRLDWITYHCSPPYMSNRNSVTRRWLERLPFLMSKSWKLLGATSQKLQMNLPPRYDQV